MVTSDTQKVMAQVVVFIQKESDGFRVVIRRADGGSVEQLVSNLVYVLGTACQNFGATVKM